MDITLVILLALISAASAVALLRGGPRLLFAGFLRTARLIQNIWLRLLLGFTLGGLVTVIIPRELVTEWLGPASGIKGILIASYAGIVIGGGGAFVAMPLAVSLLVAGVGVGPVIALLTGWNLINLRGLFVWQIPFLGMELALSRYIVCLLLPPVAGVLGGLIYQLITAA